MEFSGKSIIITGAGKGIGRATAELLAQRGAEIVAVSRTRSDLDSLRAEIGGRSIAADLSSPDGARQAMAEAGLCDMLVNCAGTNVLESVLDMTEGGYETVMGINLRSPLICAQEFARSRVSAGGGWCDRQRDIHRRASRLSGSRLLCRLQGRP
jgi:NAD(P)-dependent dehydrogenase (short-subunit alcohol dehydrogenase family)